jgi:hypothetical protein
MALIKSKKGIFLFDKLNHKNTLCCKANVKQARALLKNQALYDALFFHINVACVSKLILKD